LGLEWKEVAGQRKLQNEELHDLYSSLGILDGRGMWYIWGRGIHTGFLG